MSQQNYKRVLIVDDDKVMRTMIGMILTSRGYIADQVNSVSEARNILSEERQSDYDCVITDYYMPGENGIELIKWIQDYQPTLSTILLTSTEETDVIKKTFRSGAVDCLPKPINQKVLFKSVTNAVEVTKQQREAQQTQKSLREIGKFQNYLLQSKPPNLPVEVFTCNFPQKEAGGDSLTIIPVNKDQVLVVVTDVSGHDLKAAFVSTFFQGLLRGMIQRKAPITEILRFFNNYLLNEWSKLHPENSEHDVVTSLAVCAIQMNLKTGNATVINSGFPSANYTDGEGYHERAVLENNCPLGWFESLESEHTLYPIPELSTFTLWTDGLEDLALALNVDRMALAYHLFHYKKMGNQPPCIKKSKDDILLVRVVIPSDNESPEYYPIISEMYSGNEFNEVDAFQSTWENSLKLVIEDLNQEHLIAFLLCAREILLNGLNHGCQGSEEKACHFQIAYNPVDEKLRLCVRDPGKGHRFDFKKQFENMQNELVDASTGLSIVYGLAEDLKIEDSGSCVKAIFSIKNE
ncbi:MAG: response regulator [Verrucomicrobiota bacterium]